MASKSYNFTFTAIVEKSTNNGYMQVIIIVPEDILKQIDLKKSRRTLGKINGVVEFSLAIQNLKNGPKYFTINNDIRKKAKINIGSEVHIEFTIIDPDILFIPEELEICLEQDEVAKKIFESYTIGYRRSIIHYVSSAKSVDTRINRSVSLINKIKNGELRKI